MKTPQFGKIVEEKVLDKDGSTMSVESNYQHGVIRLPKYLHYEYRVRVTSPKDEMTEYLRFCDESANKLKASFRKETNKLGDSEGWYYVIKAWTEIADD